jgi:hypothetical protein
MTEIGEVSVRKRRSRQEIKRLVAEFETSGLRRGEFCQKHNLFGAGHIATWTQKAPDGSKGPHTDSRSGESSARGIFQLLSPAPALSRQLWIAPP